jgi:hypothetical protein
MALTEPQSRELRSLMQSWSKASQQVGEMLRGAAVTADGLDMQTLRKAVDERVLSEQLVIAFWSRAMGA